MNTSQGYINEEQMVHEINGKKFTEINQNVQYMLRFIFPFIDVNRPLVCYKTEEFIKPDIMIQHESEQKFVSLKYGTSETVHTENILSFLNFLRYLGIDEETINTYLLFHYGDGTTDGTGTKRMSSAEVRFNYADAIREMNKKLNASKPFIKAFADRVLFSGVNPQAYRADFIYHGDVNYGVIISRGQIMNHIERKNWDFMDCPHIGPFVLRPKVRYSEKEILEPEKRNYVVVTYPRLFSDVVYISKRYSTRN